MRRRPRSRSPIAFEPDQNEIDVYFAIPPWRDGGLNVAAPRVGADTRYIAAGDHAAGRKYRPFRKAGTDRAQELSLSDAERIAAGDRLHAGGASEAFRIRRMHAGLNFRSAAARFSCRATTWSRSHGGCRKCCLPAARALSGTRRQRNQSLAEFSASDIADFWLLYTVNSYAPLINHLYEAGTRHPEHLFEAMASLAGALTTFSTTLHPRDIPVYDHDNLSLCFTNLDEKLRALLETTVPTNCVCAAAETGPAVHLCHRTGRGQISEEHANVSGGERRSVPVGDHRKDAGPGESLLRQSYRPPDDLCACRAWN